MMYDITKVMKIPPDCFSGGEWAAILLRVHAGKMALVLKCFGCFLVVVC